MQSVMPRLMEAHFGSVWPQSQHLAFPGMVRKYSQLLIKGETSEIQSN